MGCSCGKNVKVNVHQVVRQKEEVKAPSHQPTARNIDPKKRKVFI